MNVFKIPLQVVSENRKTVTACFDGNLCLVRVPTSLHRQPKRALAYVDRVYWRLLSDIYLPKLKERTDELNRAFYGFDYRSVRYHRQFRRWGSCSSLGNINLSHRLIEAPQLLVDYVILHELAHLKHLNHSREFWGLIKQVYGDYRAARKAITQYGYSWQTDYRQWLAWVLQSLETKK